MIDKNGELFGKLGSQSIYYGVVRVFQPAFISSGRITAYHPIEIRSHLFKKENILFGRKFLDEYLLLEERPH